MITNRTFDDCVLMLNCPASGNQFNESSVRSTSDEKMSNGKSELSKLCTCFIYICNNFSCHTVLPFWDFQRVSFRDDGRSFFSKIKFQKLRTSLINKKSRPTIVEWNLTSQKPCSTFVEWDLTSKKSCSTFVEWDLTSQKSSSTFVERGLTNEKLCSTFVEWGLTSEKLCSTAVEWGLTNEKSCSTDVGWKLKVGKSCSAKVGDKCPVVKHFKINKINNYSK